MTVIWRATAREDLAQIFEYIAQDNPVAAQRVARQLVLAGDGLEQFPRRGREGRIAGTRELVTQPPYIIIYEIGDDGNVNILRLWHAAQNWP